MSRVQSIERAFAILGALSDGPLGVTEVAARVRLPKSTVARLLSALQAEGAVEQVPGDTRYRVGARVTTLAARTLPGTNIVTLARPDLAELAAAAGEAAGLGVPDGDAVHYIDQVDTPNAVQARDWTGTRVPMHAVPSGQVLLARLGPEALEAYLRQPRERFTPHTLTDPDALRARLERVRSDGYAWVREEFDVGISSVAAAIVGSDGTAVAAIHVHGPSYRFPRPGSEERLAAGVVAAAQRISGRLGALGGRRGT